MRRSVPSPGKIVRAAILFLAMCAWPNASALAELYKYQKNGVWYFTDTPTADMPDDRKVVEGSGRPSPAPTAAGTPLLADYPTRNAIELAAAATVAVKSAWGFGSGFFVSPQGHIITNKHVLRSMEKQGQETEANFKQMEARFNQLDQQLADEELRLQLLKDRVDQMKAASQAESHAQGRSILQKDYEAHLKQYASRRSDLDKRLKAFESEKRSFHDNRRNYTYSKSIADLAQSFTIVLADKTEFYARLIRISPDHDLALLKMDGHRTPCLAPDKSGRLAQSDPVYAIGSPAQLQNSVTSGVFSGFQAGFLQTNAQIYPGNSGGPLVSAAGHVLGVNTFKTLTHKFEGLGFAIPIEIALREFSADLP